MRKHLRWVVAILALGACASDGCDRYYAGLEIFVPTSNAYRLRYPSPPWQLESSSGNNVELRIDRDLGVVGDASVPSKFSLIIDVLPGTTASAEINRLIAAATAADHEIVVPRREVVTETGDEGFEALTRETGEERTVNHRYVTFDGADGCVRMTWTADPSLDSAEVDAIIHVFDVRNVGEAGDASDAGDAEDAP